jgi:hypothetical protein
LEHLEFRVATHAQVDWTGQTSAIIFACDKIVSVAKHEFIVDQHHISNHLYSAVLVERIISYKQALYKNAIN